MAVSAGGHHRPRWMIPILLLAFLLRMASLDAQSMWYDEAFYAMVSSVDLPSLPDMVLDVRVHPPLYFVILHFWLGLGHGEFVLRSLSDFSGSWAVASIYPLKHVQRHLPGIVWLNPVSGAGRIEPWELGTIDRRISLP